MYTRSEPALLPFYPRLVYLTLREAGYQDEQLFKGLDLGPGQLEDEKFRLSIDQHEQFILRVLELTDDPHFALRLSRQFDPKQSNVALLAIANGGQIARALHLLTRYSPLFTRVFTISALEDHGGFLLEIEPHLEHDQVVYFALGSFVLFLDAFFRDALHGAHLVERAELSIPAPPGFDTVRERFGVPLTFGHERTRIYIDTRCLDRPIKQADPQTVRLLTEMCELQLRALDAETGIVGAVTTLLVENIAAPPRLDAAAKRLGVSARGLRRKLAASGTTYQTLLDSLRARIAIRLLRETVSPVASIAYELGFDNASDFGRAFKKWTGQPPSALRAGNS